MNQNLKKHVAAIHISTRLTLLQRKIANVLLFHAYEHLLTWERHTITIGRLAKMAGFDSNNYKALKDALRTLAETSIEWDILTEGKAQWGISTMLAEAVIESGVCRYAYSPSLREKLYNPEIFARINLAVQAKFASGHALALYENCVRFRRVGGTGWLPLETVRRLLGVSETERYSSFKYLNDEVLKRSIKEINATSDVTVTQEVRKEGRNVVAVKFHITEKEPHGEERPGTAVPVTLMTGDRAQEHTQAIVGRLMAFGITRRQAEDVLRKRGDDYVTEVLDVVEAAFERGKVTNLTAFTAAALRDDYRPKRPCYEEMKEKERQQAIAAREAARVQELERQRAAVREERERLLQALDQLRSDERETLEREFSDVLARENDILTHFLERDGISKNPLIRAAFETFARKHLFGDSSPIPQPG